MDVNDNACFLIKRGALESIASKLAPTKAKAKSNCGDLCVCLYTEKRETSKLRPPVCFLE